MGNILSNPDFSYIDRKLLDSRRKYEEVLPKILGLFTVDSK